MIGRVKASRTAGEAAPGGRRGDARSGLS